MEHIYFEAQLCSEIAILKEKSKKAKKQTITFGGWSFLENKHKTGFTTIPPPILGIEVRDFN